jgi:CheY-like chemotaxis protein
MPRNPARQEYRRAILDGMASALWLHAWLANGRTRGLAPSTPPAAAKPAADLARLVEALNSTPLDALFAAVWRGSRLSPGLARRFGEELADDALGISAHASADMRLPTFEISYDHATNELEWEGDAEPAVSTGTTRNPAIEQILLIEDEAPRQDDMVRLFKRIYPGAVVTIADNAIDANALIDAHRYDLIVSDFDLADGTTGGDVLDYLHERHPKMVNRFLFVAGNPIVQDLHPYWMMKGEVTKAATVAAIARMPVANPSCCSGCA